MFNLASARECPARDTTRTSLEAKRRIIERRALLIRGLRDFFYNNDYLEVETPVLSPYALPEVNIDPLECAGGLLLPSPEAFMKPLLNIGWEKIFQIGKCYRAGEFGKRHRPEFTMLEWYRLGVDYSALLAECEELVCHAASYLGLSRLFSYAGKSVSIEMPFLRMDVAAAFEAFAARSLESVLAADNFDEVFAEEVEPKIPSDRAVFLCNYPVSAGGFAKRRADNPLLGERFELYIGGLEIANACSEIDCRRESAERIAQEMSARAALGKSVHPLPPYFLKEDGEMPPSAGAALGVERLLMLFSDASDIAEVIAFP